MSTDNQFPPGIRVNQRWQENKHCAEVIGLLSRAWPNLKVSGCRSFLWTADDDMGTGSFEITVSGDATHLIAAGILTEDMLPKTNRMSRKMGWVAVRRLASGYSVNAVMFDDHDDKPAEARVRDAMALALVPLIWRPSI